MLLEPGHDVRIQPDRDRLLAGAVELAATREHPAFLRDFGNIDRVDLVVRQCSQCRKLIALVSTKVFPAHIASFRAASPHSARLRISSYRSDLPSKPMPGRSGMVMKPSSTRTPSGKPP